MGLFKGKEEKKYCEEGEHEWEDDGIRTWREGPEWSTKVDGVVYTTKKEFQRKKCRECGLSRREEMTENKLFVWRADDIYEGGEAEDIKKIIDHEHD